MESAIKQKNSKSNYCHDLIITKSFFNIDVTQIHGHLKCVMTSKSIFALEIILISNKGNIQSSL